MIYPFLFKRPSIYPLYKRSKAVITTPKGALLLKRLLQWGPGISLCFGIAIFADYLNQWLPIGSITLAIVMGILIRNLIKLPDTFSAGITVSDSHFLALAIALMGVELDFNLLLSLGPKPLLLIATCIPITILVTRFLGNRWQCGKEQSLLIGIGTSICGSAAIAACHNILKAKKSDIGISIAIVNGVGTIGIFILPVITQKILGLNDLNSGLMIGNALQAVGQVLAAGFSLGPEVGQTATLVKMARILMLSPLILILIGMHMKEHAPDWQAMKKGIPAFIIGFILCSLIPTFHLLPAPQIQFLSHISDTCLMIAMAGIGLNISLDGMISKQKKSLALGSVSFIIQLSLSYLFLRLYLG